MTLPRTDAAPLFLRATQEFHFADHAKFPGERKVATDAYAYTLSESADLAPELLAWHWQPEAGHEPPHMHIGRGHPRLGELGRLHVPSGRVAFEQVLVFALDEMAVVPAHADARRTLGDTLRRFTTYRTWS